MRYTLALITAFSLASCGGNDASDQGEMTSEERPDSPQVTAYDDLAAVVSANGVSRYQGEPITFGAPRADVDAAMEEAFGFAGEPGSNEECGAGPMDFSQYGPLQLGFMDGRFTGWFLRESPIGGEGGKDGVVTSDGVRPGVSTLSGLKGERAVRELDTTLEGEFQYETMDYGTITGFSTGDAITGLQAGIGCVFR